MISYDFHRNSGAGWSYYLAICILFMSMAYIGFLLPIRPAGVASGVSFAWFLVVQVIAFLGAALAFLAYMRDGYWKIGKTIWIILLIVSLHVFSSIAWLFSDFLVNLQKTLLALYAGILAIFGLYIGSLLPRVFRKWPRLVLFSLLSYIVILLIRFKLDNESLDVFSIIAARYFVLQSAAIVFLMVWALNFSGIQGVKLFLLCVLLLILVLMSGSRSLLGAVLVYMTASRFASWSLYLRLAFVVLVGILGLYLLTDSLMTTLYGSRAADGFFHDDSRAEIWRAFWGNFLSQPWAFPFGFGSHIGDVNIEISDGDTVNIQFPHNTYILILISAGGLGVLLFMCLIWRILRVKRAWPFLAFILIFGMANDIPFFLIHSSQLINLIVWYMVFGLVLTGNFIEHRNPSAKSD